jgi:hypothetical protein
MRQSCQVRSRWLQKTALTRPAGITNGNIYAPTMMIAEKSADLILGNTPLQPLQSQFYRRHASCASKGSKSKGSESKGGAKTSEQTK